MTALAKALLHLKLGVNAAYREFLQEPLPNLALLEAVLSDDSGLLG